MKLPKFFKLTKMKIALMILLILLPKILTLSNLSYDCEMDYSNFFTYIKCANIYAPLLFIGVNWYSFVFSFGEDHTNGITWFGNLTLDYIVLVIGIIFFLALALSYIYLLACIFSFCVDKTKKYIKNRKK